MSTFARLQSDFQRCIVDAEDDGALIDLLDGAREHRDVLFNVYRNAYVSRLVEIMQNTHGLLHAYLGDEGFDEMARAYIAAHPSRHPNVRWLTQKLPVFLRENEPYSDYPVFAELAMLEVALDNAFDALDQPVAVLDDLAAIPPEAWTDLCFRPHQCACRFDFATNALDVWSALREDEVPPDATEDERQTHIIVWRQDATSMVRPMSDEEAMMWDEAAKDVPFGVLCTMVATYDDPDNAAARAAGYLHGWITSGMLTAVTSA